MSDSVKYQPKITMEQKKELLNFMEEHPDFAKGKLLGVGGRKVWQSLWEDLTKILNNSDGPEKTTAKWQRVWTDIKNSTKKKVTSIKRQQCGTGGGLQLGVILSDFDSRIIDIISENELYGLEGVPSDSEETETTEPLRSQMEVAESKPALLFTTDTSLANPSPPGNFSDASSQEATPNYRIPRQISTAATAVAVYEDPCTEQNKKIDEINNKLDLLIDEHRLANEERKRTNNILEKMLEYFKTTNK